MKASKRIFEFIKEKEGLSLTAYRCSAGMWTIGYGHTGNVTPGMTITVHDAEILLKKDIQAKAEIPVNQLVHSAINQNQYDALVSFTFNCGSGNLQKSTLLQKVNAKPNDPYIKDEFLKWNKAGGKVLPGLTKRREAEAKIYFEQ